jgi:disulfide bond formation protein DsbB
MILTTRAFAGFVLAAGILVLGSALASQYWAGLAPCELCLLQRWPWRVAIAVALLGLVLGARVRVSWIGLLTAIVFAVSAAFAFYHVGVEQHWFAGPTACTVQSGHATTLEEMKRQILATQPVLCDQVQWSLFGVSLAGWNLLASLIMAAISLVVAIRGRNPRAAALGDAAMRRSAT